MEQFNLSFEAPKLTVKEVTSRLRRILRTDFSNLYIIGEISGFKPAASGHLYFNLKEEDTVLSCAMFRNAARLVRFPLKDGLLVQARGSIDIYEQRGSYQLIIEHIEPLGAGALQQAFEELKKRLAAEGLFEASRKRPLPRFPRRIGIVTSPTGAVIADMLNIFRRRSPGLEIRIFPALVQGPGSAAQVTAGIEYFSSEPWADLIIVARGGGSLEDLWTFNEESVARAIAASAIPVVSAVGHETDFSIADFVADLRAPTPSAAAEIVAPAVDVLLERFEAIERSIYRTIRYRLSHTREQLLRQGVERARNLLDRRLNRVGQRLDDLEARATESILDQIQSLQFRERALSLRLIARDHRKQLQSYSDRLLRSERRLGELLTRRLRAISLEQANLASQLRQLNPTAILDRGFALVRTKEGTLVRDPSAIESAQVLEIRVARGTFEATKT